MKQKKYIAVVTENSSGGDYEEYTYGYVYSIER